MKENVPPIESRHLEIAQFWRMIGTLEEDVVLNIAEQLILKLSNDIDILSRAPGKLSDLVELLPARSKMLSDFRDSVKLLRKKLQPHEEIEEQAA